MKRTRLTIAALVAATIASGAAAPALAQDAATGPNAKPQQREMQMRGQRGDHHFAMRRDFGRDQGPRMGMRRGGAGILALVCSEKGADRLEHSLLNLRQRTDPTTEQQSLFDSFQTAALTAQTDFADACAKARPAADAAIDADVVDRMRAGLEIQQAHLDAMNSVLPAFEAFYDSLSDEQKQSISPRRQRDGERHGPRFERHRGPGADRPTPQQDG